MQASLLRTSSRTGTCVANFRLSTTEECQIVGKWLSMGKKLHRMDDVKECTLFHIGKHFPHNLALLRPLTTIRLIIQAILQMPNPYLYSVLDYRAPRKTTVLHGGGKTSWLLCNKLYTAKLLFHQPLCCTVTARWLDSDSVVTVNCQQHGDYIAIGSLSPCCRQLAMVTTNTVTIQSHCSHCV